MRFKDKLIENLIFRRSGLNSMVFEKNFISYSCILFIKHCALSFCIKMLCFSKKLIFPDFWSIKPIAWTIEIAIKNLVWICLACLLLNWCWIDRMWFLIDRIYFSTDRKLVSEFLKRFFSHVFITLFMPFSKSIQSQQFFVVFLLKSLMFLSSCAGTTFLPLLFHFIHIFHAF